VQILKLGCEQRDISSESQFHDACIEQLSAEPGWPVAHFQAPLTASRTISLEADRADRQLIFGALRKCHGATFPAQAADRRLPTKLPRECRAESLKHFPIRHPISEMMSP
jgi:hypothetical protein